MPIDRLTLTWVNAGSGIRDQIVLTERQKGKRTMSPTAKILALTVATALWIQGGVGQAWASIESGRALAIDACSACHQVVSTQKKPPPVADGNEGARVGAPTFTQIADKCLPSDQLRAKIASPHYPMREQMLGDIDLDALSAYIRSLKPARDCSGS
jgi:mono/diheme cytochrome c family protein